MDDKFHTIYPGLIASKAWYVGQKTHGPMGEFVAFTNTGERAYPTGWTLWWWQPYKIISMGYCKKDVTPVH